MCHKLFAPLILAVPLLVVFPARAQTPAAQTQVRFLGPSGMQIRWQYRTAEGKVEFSKPLEAPARYNFRQGGVYRLKLTHIPGYPGLELYPTLQVPVPGSLAQEYLAHNAVQFALRDEDIREARAGKQLTKSIYVPGAGPEAGPGAVVLVFRLGDLDLEGPKAHKK